MMDEKFRDEIDAAFPRLGFTDRSTFIRDAVYKRLEQLNIRIPESLKGAPSRAGKGGRPKKKRVEINQTSNRIAIGHIENLSSTSGAPARKSAKPQRGKRKPDK